MNTIDEYGQLIIQRPDQQVDELQRRIDARNSLQAFIRYMNPCGHEAVRFDPALHHLLIIREIERLVFAWEENREPTEEDPRLVVVQSPAGSAKSTYTQILGPIWCLARNPQMKILTLTGTIALVEQFARDRRNLMRTQLWQNISETSLDPETQSLELQATTQGGQIRSVSANGSCLGFRSDANFYDDLVTGFTQAQSQPQLSKLWNWMQGDARSRCKPNSFELMVGTAYSVQDPAGMLLKRHRLGQEKLKHLKFQLLCEDPKTDQLGRTLQNELMWPEWFNQTTIDTATANPVIFNASWQQNPPDHAGAVFPQENFHIIEPKDIPTRMNIFVTFDTALSVGKGDWTVIAQWGICMDRYLYCLDVWRDRCTPDVIADNVIRISYRDRDDLKYVVSDDAPAEKMFKTVLQQKCKELGKPIPYDQLPLARQDKESRASGFRSLYIQGLVRFKQDDWNAWVLNEMMSFGAAAQHDDFIDCASLAGRLYNKVAPPARAQVAKPATPAFTIGEGGVISASATLDEMFEDSEDRRVVHGFEKLRV